MYGHVNAVDNKPNINSWKRKQHSEDFHGFNLDISPYRPLSFLPIHSVYMNRDEQVLELTAIYEEYKFFFPLCELNVAKPSITIDSDDVYARMLSRDKNFIRIKTSEGTEFRVSVEVAGWFVLKEKHYETFEALMMELSPSFQARHAGELTSKLQDLLHSALTK